MNRLPQSPGNLKRSILVLAAILARVTVVLEGQDSLLREIADVAGVRRQLPRAPERADEIEAPVEVIEVPSPKCWMLS